MTLPLMSKYLGTCCTVNTVFKYPREVWNDAPLCKRTEDANLIEPSQHLPYIHSLAIHWSKGACDQHVRDLQSSHAKAFPSIDRTLEDYCIRSPGHDYVTP